MIFSQKEDNRLVEIPTLYIRPNRSQPRKTFAHSDLVSLAQSISVNGILQPLTVRKTAQNDYELISGERRLRGAIMAGLKKVPCVIMRCNDKQSAVFALIENLQRADLNMFEEARAIKKLIIDCSLTQDKVAKQLGKKQSTIANKLRLLRLTDLQQQIVLENGLSERHARVILKLNGDERTSVLNRVISENLNVAQTEKLINEMICENCCGEKHHTVNNKLIIKDVRIFLNTFVKAFDTMKLSGINAVSSKKENDEYIEYSVKIPKTSVYRSAEDNTENVPA